MNSRERLLASCMGKPVDQTPIWFMRQAGRIFKEYREIREKHDFVEVCKTPELNSRVTLMPVKKLDVDAAIIFSDIMIPLEALGIDYELVKGTGPVIDNPIRKPRQVEELSTQPVDEILPDFFKSMKRVRSDLSDDKALIGFAGAPFTLACYMIEGRPSRNFHQAKFFMLEHPEAWHQLMEKLRTVLVDYLRGQINAGADLWQLFDSWVGGLSPTHFEEYALPHIQYIFNELKETGIPSIFFGTSIAGLVPTIEKTGADVIGLDWTIEIEAAQKQFSQKYPVQGNLDPALLLCEPDKIKKYIDRILIQAKNCPGHIFNLGHGLLPDTPVDNIRHVINYVREKTHTKKSASQEDRQ